MADRNEGNAIQLSSSVQSVEEKLASLERVNSWHIVEALFSVHDEYASQRAKLFFEEAPPEGLVEKPFSEWIREVYSLYEPNSIDFLHGRVVIIGLALIDHDLLTRLVKNELLKPLVLELKRPLENILSPYGIEIFSRARKAFESPDNVNKDVPDKDIPKEPGIVDQTKPPLPASVPTIPDRPVTVDELGREVLAKTLAKRIRSVRKNDEDRLTQAKSTSTLRKVEESDYLGPFRINLYGPWGSGKSSFLNFLKDDLKKEETDDDEEHQNPWVVVEFNSWQHQRISPPWWFFMEAVYRQGRQQVSGFLGFRRLWLTITEICWRASHSWAPVAVALTAVFGLIWAGYYLDVIPSFQINDPSKKTWLTLLSAQAKNISAILTVITAVFGILLTITRGFFLGFAQTAGNLQRQKDDPMQSIARHFNKILCRIKSPVAVFIDDLDRCDGEYVIELLEGIQTIFKNAPVTYVISADRRWIRTAYQNAYYKFAQGVKEPGRPLGTMFLEKTFHLLVPIPSMSMHIKSSFWKKLIGMKRVERREKLQEARMKANEAMKNLVYEEEILDKSENIKDDFVLGQAYREAAAMRFATAEFQSFAEHSLQPFVPLLEDNPRSLIRLVNSYSIRRSLSTLVGIRISQQELALWTILDMRWPELSEYLEENPSKVNFIGKEQSVLEQEVPRKLRPLFMNKDVKKVVEGDANDVTEKLDEDIISKCNRFRS